MIIDVGSGNKNINFHQGGGGKAAKIEERKAVTYTDNGTFAVNPDEGYDAIKGADVTVNVPELRLKDVQTVTYKSNGSYNVLPDDGYDGFSKVTVDVNVPQKEYKTQEKIVKTNGEVVPDDGYDGLSKVTVDVPSSGGVFKIKNGIKFGYTRSDNFYVENIDTSDITDMFQMFANAKIKEFDITNWDTSNVIDMSQMFANADFYMYQPPNKIKLNTPKVTNMSKMFTGYYGINRFDFSSFDMSNVTFMYSMFYNSSQLDNDELIIHNWNISKVTDLSKLCYQSQYALCDFTGWDTSSVTDMSMMFFYCNNTKSILLTGWDTSKVTNMRGLFRECSKLTSLDVSNFNTSNVTDMGTMFEGCDALTSLDVSNFNTSNVTDMADMFWGCDALTSLDVSNFNTSNVTDMGGMFNCGKITSLDLSNFDTANVTRMNYMFGTGRLINLTRLLLSSKFFNSTSLTTYDFSYLTNWTDADSLATFVSALPQLTSTKTVQLSTATKNALTDDQKTTIANKGWTIA